MAETASPIKPQPGPQESFLASPADIAIFGGSAGSGKSYSLLMEPARHVGNEKFSGVIFRRTYPQIVSPGGLWDTAGEIYPTLSGRPNTADHSYTFPSGAKIGFSHLQHEKDKYSWQGSQIPFIGFDELTHFSWSQFTYLLGRNRSACGINPYIRATCNPDPDHWLRRFLDWWIGDDGFPIAERSGKIRWMAVIGGETQWGDSRAELVERHGPDTEPLSVTFIPAKLEDNPLMMKADPAYRSKLKALPRHERERLLDGNWDAKPDAGDYFQRGWFQVVKVPPVCEKWVRYWDRAATVPSPSNPDPDYTAGGLLGRTAEGRIVIAHVERERLTPHGVETLILNTASRDGKHVLIGLEQEPGASGKSEGQYLVKRLQGYNSRLCPKRTRKEQDWGPLSAQAQAGNVMIVEGSWNEPLFNELESLPNGAHDDQADAISGAFNLLVSSSAKAGVW